ncbi:hypothetical protein SNE40_012777 [Patella caerulea]|uniref:Succinate dehydrogenase [ubiquinone] cytochrome b small subunit n=1 Tax=Patella caerulea TaxID=87958 RepID=A0AAN8JI11_PATCE
MATTVQILRCCTRGSRILFQSALLRNTSVGTKTTFGTSSALTNVFEARRGPFTPEEKRGKGHMMSASTHWKVERILMIGMIPLMPAALFYQSPFIDHAICTAVFLHGYWGMDGVLTDYLEKFVPWVKPLWTVLSIIAFAGLVNFNYNDVGLCKAVQMLWSM